MDYWEWHRIILFQSELHVLFLQRSRIGSHLFCKSQQATKTLSTYRDLKIASLSVLF